MSAIDNSESVLRQMNGMKLEQPGDKRPVLGPGTLLTKSQAAPPPLFATSTANGNAERAGAGPMVDQNSNVQQKPFSRMAAMFGTSTANTTTPAPAGVTSASLAPTMAGVNNNATTAVDISPARVETARSNLGLSPKKIRISKGRGKAI